MSRSNKRQRWTNGAIVRIDLGEFGWAYGQMLEEPEYALFAEPGASAPLSAIVASPVLFRVWVTRRAHASGRWEKVGVAPVSPSLAEPVLRFNQDPLRPSHIVLGYDGVTGRECSAEECLGYERAAVWEPEHVEERLASHRVGRESEWVRRLRISGA